MQTIRRWHLYLSCFFSPVLIYFCLSGAWQTFRWNDLPKNASASLSQRIFHELSKPHKEGTLPNQNPNQSRSNLFNAFALLMGMGIVATAAMGIFLALKLPKRRRIAIALLAIGTLLPIVFLAVA